MELTSPDSYYFQILADKSLCKESFSYTFGIQDPETDIVTTTPSAKEVEGQITNNNENTLAVASLSNNALTNVGQKDVLCIAFQVHNYDPHYDYLTLGQFNPEVLVTNGPKDTLNAKQHFNSVRLVNLAGDHEIKETVMGPTEFFTTNDPNHAITHLAGYYNIQQCSLANNFGLVLNLVDDSQTKGTKFNCLAPAPDDTVFKTPNGNNYTQANFYDGKETFVGDEITIE